MKYLELTVHTFTEASELVADVMWEYADGGVAVCDVNDVIALQQDKSIFWDYIDEDVFTAREEALVKCYLPLEEADKANAIMREIKNRQEAAGDAINFGSLEESKREVEGDDWIDIWKKHFRPIHIGKIVIVPEWIAYEKQAGEEVVLLDSNMAFGTGEHETTSMCVEFLQKYIKEGDVCLDVGCGSGILGICAAKLGAARCYLTDIDPIAVESATHNALKNNTKGVFVSQSNLLDGVDAQADLVLANITAEPLVLLAPAVKDALKGGGVLIVSGIIPDRLEKVKTAYAALSFTLKEERREGEWYALVFEKEL